MRRLVAGLPGLSARFAGAAQTAGKDARRGLRRAGGQRPGQPVDAQAVVKAEAVHSLCPGAVNSNLAREAPAFLKPVPFPVMRLAFASPEKAAAPVIYACCAEDTGRRSGAYLHFMQEKDPSPHAMDEAAGARLREAGAALLAKHAPAG